MEAERGPGSQDSGAASSKLLQAQLSPSSLHALCIGGCRSAHSHADPLGSNSLGAQQMPKVVFERTGVALWAQVAGLSVSLACELAERREPRVHL